MKSNYKWLLLSAGLCWGMDHCLAQDLVYDSTTRPEIYPSKVAMFRANRHSRKDIVFLGNSITFWADWAELLHRPHIKNRGIPGDNTFGILERLDEVIDGHPAKVFILIGINDIAKNIPDPVILHNYQRIIHRIKQGSPRTKICFQTLLPVNPSFNKLKAHYQPGRIRAINTQLAELAAREQITLIDLYPHYTDAEGYLQARLSFDGVHLNKAGYDIWVDVLRKGKYLR